MPLSCSAAPRAASHWLKRALPGRWARTWLICCTRACRSGSRRRAAPRPASRHKRVWSRRRQASSFGTDGAKTGASLSQASTASLLALQAQALTTAMSAAPAWLVDSFQPVSSRICTPRLCNTARTRRVKARSADTSATGVRPAAIWSNTQAALRSASSWKSAQACTLQLRGDGTALAASASGRSTQRAPHSSARAWVSGSGLTPWTAITQSHSCKRAGANNTSLA